MTQTKEKTEWRKLFPLPWSLLSPSVTWIAAKNGEHAADIRGWGFMTGTGGGLAMKSGDAIAIQREMAEHVANCVTAHDDLVAVLSKIRSVYGKQNTTAEYALALREEIDAALSKARGEP